MEFQTGLNPFWMLYSVSYREPEQSRITNNNIMFTPLTQAAIAILSYIARNAEQYFEPLLVTSAEMDMLLHKLATAGIICLKDTMQCECDSSEVSYTLNSYQLVRYSSEISLLDILEAIDEPLDCGRKLTEKFYTSCGRNAQKLSVVNQVARIYMEEIKLYDL